MSFAALYCSVDKMFHGKWTLKVGPIRTWLLKWNRQHLCLLENNCLYSLSCHMVAYKGLKWDKAENIDSWNAVSWPQEGVSSNIRMGTFLKWEHLKEMSEWVSALVRVRRRMALCGALVQLLFHFHVGEFHVLFLIQFSQGLHVLGIMQFNKKKKKERN